MNSQEKINSFIKLRSEGLKFEKIASVLKVTERTLRTWNKKYYVQIEEMVLLRQQDLMTELLVSRNARLRFFADEFKKLRGEVSRSVPRLHYQNLLKVTVMLNKEIEKFDLNSDSLPQNSVQNINDEVNKISSENPQTSVDTDGESL